VGSYISKDPIGLAGGNPTLYGYVKDVNSWVDVWGLLESEPIRIYDPAPYHGRLDTSVKNKAPINGQGALDNSVQIKSTSPRRIGIADGEIVILDKTRTVPGKVDTEIYHGHVRSWDELTDDMKKALKKEGMVDKKGRIKGNGH
jgi:uncharacterized protein RhaS with RHS repeats